MRQLDANYFMEDSITLCRCWRYGLCRASNSGQNNERPQITVFTSTVRGASRSNGKMAMCCGSILNNIIDSFKEYWPHAWPDLDAALREVHESFGTGRMSRVALHETGVVLGWIGGISQYGGNVWELHPLVVHPAHRHTGSGRALVADLEQGVRARGGITLWVSTDDENHRTTLAGVELYPNVVEHLANVRNLREHPYEFYQKLGFICVAPSLLASPYRVLRQVAVACSCGAIMRAKSAREAPNANRERTSKSRDTEGSPASILATRD